MLPFLLATTPAVIDTAAIEQQAQAPALIAQDTSPAATQPSPTKGTYPYASIKLGAGFPNTWTGSTTVGPFSSSTSLNLNGGFTGELALGYQFNRVRSELAVGYGSYAVGSQTFSIGNFTAPPLNGNGSLNLLTVMVNGYYDFPIKNNEGQLSRWSPYIGAGIGYGNLSAPACSGVGCFAGGSTGGFAYQGLVGVSYKAAPKGNVFAEVGYLGVTGGTVDSYQFDSFGSFRVFLGWRQGFGQ